MSQIQLNKLNSQTFLRDLTRLSYLPQCLERNMGELHLVLLWMKGLHNTKSIYTQVVIKNKIKSTPKYIQLKKKKSSRRYKILPNKQKMIQVQVMECWTRMDPLWGMGEATPIIATPIESSPSSSSLEAQAAWARPLQSSTSSSLLRSR